MARPTRDLKRKKYSEPDTDDEFEEEDNDSPHEDEDADEDDEKVGIAKKKSKTSKLGEWIVDDNLFVLKHKNFVADPTGNKVASFDFDSTLVEPKSGRKFATNAADWKMWNDKVPEKLKELHKDGWKLVIFTNQGGVAKGHLTAQAVISRVEAFIEAAVGTDVPFMVLAAAGDDHHRKPATGMWDHMVKDYFGNDPKRIDMTKSVYVGDAAGRPKEWNGNKKTKKDHSCGDRKFAMNVGIAFHTPEEFFLGEPEYKGWKLDVYDVKKHWATNDKKPYNTKDLISDKQELVVFAGFPASGKSTFFKKHFLPNGYVHVNRDTLQTPAKCQKAAVEALKQGKSVVIDNTNPDVESRKAYLKIARDAKVQARCFQFTTPRDLAEHLNMMREKLTEGASKHVPGVAYNTYNKKRVEVSDKEGWDEVKEIEFVPDFADDLAKTRFFEYT